MNYLFEHDLNMNDKYDKCASSGKRDLISKYSSLNISNSKMKNMMKNLLRESRCKFSHSNIVDSDGLLTLLQKRYFIQK